MRVYLDTNILAFMVGQDQGDSLSPDVDALVNEYETGLLASTLCVTELIHLIQIGKVRIPQCKDIRRATQQALAQLEEMGVEIVPVQEKHLKEFADLPLYPDHRDPIDRQLVAQAISDRLPLVSSDNAFVRYTCYGLDFIYNKR